MIRIRQEIQAVIDGAADRKDNVLKNAPHTAAAIASDDWTHPYSREEAAYPVPVLAHAQVLAECGTDRQSVRRPEPYLRLPADRSLRRCFGVRRSGRGAARRVSRNQRPEQGRGENVATTTSLRTLTAEDVFTQLRALRTRQPVKYSPSIPASSAGSSPIPR